VTILTEPPGADIAVDGRPLGRTPATFTDQPSDGHYYRIDLALPGYKTTQKVLKQEEQKSTVVLAGCCPPARICLLWSSALPASTYSFQLVPELGTPMPPPTGYNAAPEPMAPPPPPVP
jgi:hypothetical protein